MTGPRHHAQPLHGCWDPDAGPHVHTALTMISHCMERMSLCVKADDMPYEPWHLGDKDRDSGPHGLLEQPALEDTHSPHEPLLTSGKASHLAST